MNASIFSRLEKTPYPTGTISHDGEQLRVFAKNETAYTLPVRLPSSTPPFFPIFIPTKRNILKNSKNINRIMKLAAERDNSLLILLCSGTAKKEDAELLAEKYSNLQWIAVDGPFSYEHGIHRFETNESPLSWGTEKDQAQKRNFALQLARYMKWESIFFLDDDVAISRAQLDKAYTLLQTKDVSVVGFNARHFPDNSVAMHIHPLAPRFNRQLPWYGSNGCQNKLSFRFFFSAHL